MKVECSDMIDDGRKGNEEDIDYGQRAFWLKKEEVLYFGIAFHLAKS